MRGNPAPTASPDAVWPHDAACRTIQDPATLDQAFGTIDEQHAFAVRWCSICPVILACARAGRGEPYGVWGGRTEWHRRRRRPDATVAAAEASA